PHFTSDLGDRPTLQLIAEQLAGMEAYVLEQVRAATAHRRAMWNGAPGDAWRVDLRQWMGCEDVRATVISRELLAQSPRYTIESVVLNTGAGFTASGLTADPPGNAAPVVLALPPSDVSPEDWLGLTDRLPPSQQLARHLVIAGHRVICPRMLAPDPLEVSIVDYPSFGARPTARDEIWRLATQLGLTFAGLELQAALACLSVVSSDAPYTVVGIGDAGRLGLMLAAIDRRAERVFANCTFGDRTDPRASFAWPELIHGWALRYGDAELVALIAPRPVVLIEPLRRLSALSLLAELDACERLCAPRPRCLAGEHAADVVAQILSDMGITPVLTPRRLTDIEGMAERSTHAKQARHVALRSRLYDLLDVAAQQRVRRGMENLSARRAEWAALVGEFPAPDAPLEPRGRPAAAEFQSKGVTTYEVCLPVYRDPAVFVRGLLAVPADIEANERRPAVICSHGWEGSAESTHQPGIYNAFAQQLAARGYVTWAPQSYFRSEYTIQSLYRMTSLIGRTEFGLMAKLHARGIDYLAGLPFVDPGRIAFYGLSYGGYSALWLNGLEPRLAAVVCSGHFNDWQAKTTGQNETSYMNTENASMYVAGILTRFNHGDLAALACPRPFLVEVGDADWVVRREWVEHEFARARSVYALHGAADRIELCWGQGGHQVFGERSYEFLDQWLK
ncbi:MAG: dienelactone hydrolase family protein, partial [Chloroflexi bacterium]|nr:dienelactone hydrolase family protein [Chloroflexota bacterium]